MSNAEIVVVGAGVAGLSAALAVADAGQDVTLVTKADLVESNTYHAQGGIAAAVFADDDPKLHAADTMAAGHGLCEPRAVEILTREGTDRVRQFAAAGVHFDRDAQGHMLRGLEAAHSRARVVHAGGDATGKVVELDVSAMVRANPLIHIIEHAFLEDLIVRDGAIAGVRLLVRDGETFRSADMAASRVILATGAPDVSTRTPPIRPSPPRTVWRPHGVPAHRSPTWSSTSSTPPRWPWASTSSFPRRYAARARCCSTSTANGT